MARGEEVCRFERIKLLSCRVKVCTIKLMEKKYNLFIYLNYHNEHFFFTQAEYQINYKVIIQIVYLD